MNDLAKADHGQAWLKGLNGITRENLMSLVLDDIGPDLLEVLCKYAISNMGTAETVRQVLSHAENLIVIGYLLAKAEERSACEYARAVNAGPPA